MAATTATAVRADRRMVLLKSAADALVIAAEEVKTRTRELEHPRAAEAEAMFDLIRELYRSVG